MGEEESADVVIGKPFWKAHKASASCGSMESMMNSYAWDTQRPSNGGSSFNDAREKILGGAFGKEANGMASRDFETGNISRLKPFQGLDG